MYPKFLKDIQRYDLVGTFGLRYSKKGTYIEYYDIEAMLENYVSKDEIQEEIELCKRNCDRTCHSINDFCPAMSRLLELLEK